MATLFKDMSHIHGQSEALASEQLSFLDGTFLGDVDLLGETGETRRKIRRIIEKRVCQDMHRKGKHSFDNWSRFNGKRRVSNQMRNIFGDVPMRLAS